jgi:peptide/nickel transport system permease protein
VRLPTSFRVGVTGIVLMVLFSIVGPLLRADIPNDPVYAALLPPGAAVTALSLEGGRVIVAPRIERVGDRIVASGGGRSVEIGAGDVESSTSRRFWLGSDRFGRDVLRRLMLGGRISLAIAGLAVVLALVVGSLVGVAAATSGKLADTVLMGLVDGFLAFPILFLMILAAALVGPDPLLLVVLLGLTSWMGVARLVRGQVLSLRTRPFVLAAISCGSPWHRIFRLHYAPNLVGPVTQDTALRMGELVIAEATLSFLGLGVPPSIPTWGSMIAEGHRVMLDGWWLATLPGLAIAALVICLALVGDGLQRIGEPSA